MNRVAAAYQKMEEQIQKRIADGVTTEQAVAKTNESLNMSINEYCKFQEAKSLAVASGKLSADEGMTIYNSLGESVETFNGQPVHVKAVLTKIFSELLTAA